MLLQKVLTEGGPLLIGVIFLIMMWHKDRKHKITNEDIIRSQKKTHSKLECIDNQLDKMETQLKGLHDWHVPGLEKTMGSLSASIAKQTETMVAMMDFLKDIRRDQRTIKK